jgi:hypothetical protein
MALPAKMNLRQKLLLAAERHYLDFDLPAVLNAPLRLVDDALYGRPARSVPVDRPIFIVGCHRSGTTILYEIMARHPDLAFFTNASSLLPDLPIVTNRALDFVGERDSALERFCQDDLTFTYRTPSEGIRIWERHVDAEADYRLDERYENPAMEAYLRSTIQKHVAYFGARRFINKNPDNSVRIRYLNKLFPDAHFINIVRDGRAVCASLLRFRQNAATFFGPEHRHARGGVKAGDWPRIQTHWDTDPVLSVGLLWRDVMDTIERDRAALPGERYTQVIYEDFVASPMEHLRDIAERCELPWTAEVERTYAAEAANVTLGARNERWREQFSDDDLDRLMPIIGPVMRRYGYTVGDTPQDVAA